MNVFKILIVLYYFFVSGCMPIVIHKYYHPIADEGTLSMSLCAERIGPYDRIYFKRDEIKIGFNLSHHKKDYTFNMVFWVPKNKTVSIISNEIVLIIGDKEYRGSISKISGMPYSKDTPLYMTGFSKNQESNYWEEQTETNYYEFETKIRADKTNDVILPSIQIKINGRQLGLPEIEFTFDKYIEYFMPINC